MASNKWHYKLSRIQFSNIFSTFSFEQRKKISEQNVRDFFSLTIGCYQTSSQWHITVSEKHATNDSWEIKKKKILVREIFFYEKNGFENLVFEQKNYLHAKVDFILLSKKFS